MLLFFSIMFSQEWDFPPVGKFGPHTEMPQVGSKSASSITFLRFTFMSVRGVLLTNCRCGEPKDSWDWLWQPHHPNWSERFQKAGCVKYWCGVGTYNTALEMMVGGKTHKEMMMGRERQTTWVKAGNRPSHLHLKSFILSFLFHDIVGFYGASLLHKHTHPRLM